jgi:hypothetical protein
VLHETVHANSSTNVEAIVAQMREKCALAGLAPASADALLAQTRQVLSNLVEQGARIAAIGGQMEATRELTGDGYSLRLIFREGVRRSYMQQLLDAIRGQ